MDDLWGNAWGSPVDDATATTWPSSEKPQNDDHQEDDLAVPSWSTGPGIQWDEPSDTQSSLWSNAHHTAQDWSIEHPYGDISLGNSRLAEPLGDLPEDKNSTAESPIEAESHSFPPPSPRVQFDDITAHSPSRELDEELSPSPTPSSPSPEPSPPSSPDAFGTFTIGAKHSDTAPFPTTGGQIDNNEWGSPWGSVSKDVEEESAQFASDEWESAKLRQLEMDRRVPPELLSQILLHLEELTKDAWPETQDVAEADWQKRWHSGMDVDGIDTLLLRYIPALTLPQLPPPGRSFNAKAMADAVKLSRNTGLARTSPMSTFLAAKGSTAWETSVKSRTEKSVDEVPLGWRILEKDPKKDEKAGDRVKKPTGLLASLWNRKATSLPSNPPDQEQNIPSPDPATPENANAAQALEKRSTPVIVTTPPVSPQPSPTLASSQDEDANVLPTGSAVSRFLKRFSRPRSSSPSPRNSITLTGDDLEFLSDVRSDARPNSTDLVDTFDGDATESSRSGILRGKLPPPLPPPPKVSAPPSVRGNTLNGHTLISPNGPHLNAIPDLQNSPEEPTFSALTPLAPSPLGSPNSKSIPPNSLLSHPFPPDKIAPSLILPVSSSRPNLGMSSLPVARSQLQSASGNTTQPFDFSQDDDDFSDFRSSPAEPSLFSFNDSSPAHQGKVTSTQSSQRQFNSPFDDLVHLMSSPTTGPLNPSEGPEAPRPFSFPNPVSPTALSLPAPRESTPTHRVSFDHPTTPTHSRTQSQQPTSPSKVVPTSPKQKAIAQGHQRTQSLLDLAAARQGRWPAPPSPLPEPLQPPPPPPGKGQGETIMNVDYFGTTPTENSFTLSPPPAPLGKTSVLSSLQTGPSSKDVSPASDAVDATTQPPTRSPPLTSPVSQTGPSSRRALSPPPLPAALMNKPPAKPFAPVPLLPPPSGFRLAAPPKASPAPIAPEASPLALLMDSDAGKNVSLPDVKATPAPPVKGTGGLTAQDLSFFEGL